VASHAKQRRKGEEGGGGGGPVTMTRMRRIWAAVGGSHVMWAERAGGLSGGELLPRRPA
jgi:hypothetical protein